jgi:hypothetical protein
MADEQAKKDAELITKAFGKKSLEDIADKVSRIKEGIADPVDPITKGVDPTSSARTWRELEAAKEYLKNHPPKELIKVDGQEFKSLDQLRPELRDALQRAFKERENQNRKIAGEEQDFNEANSLVAQAHKMMVASEVLQDFANEKGEGKTDVNPNAPVHAQPVQKPHPTEPIDSERSPETPPRVFPDNTVLADDDKHKPKTPPRVFPDNTVLADDDKHKPKTPPRVFPDNTVLADDHKHKPKTPPRIQGPSDNQQQSTYNAISGLTKDVLQGIEMIVAEVSKILTADPAHYDVNKMQEKGHGAHASAKQPTTSQGKE